jgi:hypothetical protein
VQCDRDTDLAVLIRRPGPAATPDQQAVIRRFPQKCRRAADGGMVLGSATLTWEREK